MWSVGRLPSARNASTYLSVGSAGAACAYTFIVVQSCPFQGVSQSVHRPVYQPRLVVSARTLVQTALDRQAPRSSHTRSVSSIRKIHLPFQFLANKWLNSAVLSPPRCRYPVGEGANLSRASPGAGVAIAGLVECCRTDAWVRDRKRDAAPIDDLMSFLMRL